jgi:hypothetical protein
VRDARRFRREGVEYRDVAAVHAASWQKCFRCRAGCSLLFDSPIRTFNCFYRPFSGFSQIKFQGIFENTICRSTANSSEVAATCEVTKINGAKVRLPWGVHPISEVICLLIVFVNMISNQLPFGGVPEDFQRIHDCCTRLRREGSCVLVQIDTKIESQ